MQTITNRAIYTPSSRKKTVPELSRLFFLHIPLNEYNPYETPAIFVTVRHVICKKSIAMSARTRQPDFYAIRFQRQNRYNETKSPRYLYYTRCLLNICMNLLVVVSVLIISQ